MTLKEKLDSIRVALDADVSNGVDIDSVVEKGKALAQLIGLSAECKAEAKRQLEKAKALCLNNYIDVKSPMLVLKMVEADCADQFYLFEYADRLNAGITHQLDFYRSVISLYKTELETSLRN